MHRIAVVAMQDVLPFELSIPGLVFPPVRLAEGEAGYEVRICAADERIRTRLMDVLVPHNLSELETADTIIVPGVSRWSAPFCKEVVAALRAVLD